MKRALLGLLLLTGCQDHECCRSAIADAGADVLGPTPGLTEVALVPGKVNRNVDILFVVDDSDSMRDPQRRLQTQVSHFFEFLGEPRPDGFGVTMPSLHIGVITTDMGTQSTGGPAAPAVGTCNGLGRDGALQLGTATLSDRYLSDIANADGSRTANFSDSIIDVVSQMLTVGVQGCGFQAPLAAIGRSFQNPLNAGFLRTDARLAIILISNGEDCSAASPSLFTTASTTPIGPLSTFRCTHFGVTCDIDGQTPDAMNTPGRKSGCHSNEASNIVARVTEYANHVEKLKPVSRDVLFTAIVGPPSPFSVELEPYSMSNLTAAESCSYDGPDFSVGAFPAVRVASFAARLPNTSQESVCSGFVDILQRQAFRVRNLMGTSTCLPRPIETPSACQAVDIDANGTQSLLPMCGPSGSTPCFRFAEDKSACPIFQGLKVEVVRSPDSPLQDGTWTSIRCAS